MSIWESIFISLESLRANKLRSFLTIIGIVVGVAAVVTVISIGQAGKTFILGGIDKYGKGFFAVLLDSSQGSNQQDAIFTLSDLDALRRLPNLKAVSGNASAVMESKSGKENIMFMINATTSDRTALETINLLAGNFFSAAEERAGQKVIVVESNYAEKMFGDIERAIDRKIILSSKYYRIVGVYKSEKALFSNPNAKQYSAYMPITTLSSSSEGSNNKFNILYLRAASTDIEHMKNTIQEVKKTLAKRHNAPPAAYFSQTGAEAQEQVSTVFNVLQIIIGSIAGISLFVGGIGVMNIMLVSVTERTREIGIRKAIGALPRVIMSQFLIETLVLCFLGGMLGTLLGLVGAYAFSLITKWPFFISWWAILLAFGFSAAVGLFFGIYPATKAAKMQPIEALRYE